MSTEPAHIRVSHSYRHPVERVFDAFLDPSHVAEWLFATPGGVMEHTAFDPRVGGRFAIFEQRGDHLARHFGELIVIDRPRRIVFDFWVDEAPDERTRVTVTFTPTDDGCEIVLEHDLDAAWAAYADRTVHGWTTILASFHRMLETTARPH